MKYLARLKSEISIPSELPKLPKGQKVAFGSFGSDPQRHIFKNKPPEKPLIKELPKLPKGIEPEKVIELLPEVAQVRTWTPGNQFTCSCGHATGWQLDGQPFCPACLHGRSLTGDVSEPLPGTPAPSWRTTP